MSTRTHGAPSTRRLTRLEQLTLNTWRWAAVTLQNSKEPSAVIEVAALHAVLASLRDLEDPVALFTRHRHAQPEFQMILSVLPDEHRAGLPHDILDTAFLMRWTELAAAAITPQETPFPHGEAPATQARE